MKTLKVLITVAMCCVVFFAKAQNTLFQEKMYIKNTDTLKYRILYPENFSESKQYPIVLFLHGAGERGSDNKAQLMHGSKLFLNKTNRGAFPAIVIFPQCPKADYWSNVVVDRSTKPISLSFPLNTPPTKALSLVMSVLDQYISKPFVNKNKIYVGGLSMGGMGTYEILYRKPNTFAAAFAICGGGNPTSVSAYAQNTDVWIFHGAKDDVVDPKLSLAMATAYLQAGATPNVTIYADDNHNSWDSAFSEPQFLTWLFSKSK